ncbi:MAG: alpha/beta hydrolase, partial [Flavitalea sp.]
VLLLHGKNFNGYYWKDVIKFLVAAGYRVIVPDQLGFGKSDKPNVHYSFSLLASNTQKLLDTLSIQKTNIIAHSMGGMLATRFVLMYSGMVQKLIYENPIGLEDYRTFVPYKSVDEQDAKEQKSDFRSLKKYQQSYYPEWKPDYEQYVIAQYEAMQIPDFKTAALSSALTYEMIYQQPVMYEFKGITQPTLILIGQTDRTILGKNLLDKPVSDIHGQYPSLGKKLHQQIIHSTLVELSGVGHIPHIQSPEIFRQKVLSFLK